MLNYEKSKLAELSKEELVNIYGGDPYMRDLGYTLGMIAGWIVNAAEWFWNEVNTPAPGDNSALMQTNVVTLFQ